MISVISFNYVIRDYYYLLYLLFGWLMCTLNPGFQYHTIDMVCTQVVNVLVAGIYTIPPSLPWRLGAL